MSDFGDVLSESQVGCWSWVNDHVEWDETTRSLFDQQQNPTDYRSYLQCIHPEDRDAVAANIELFVKKAHYDDIEHRVIRSDGSCRWLFARGSAVLDGDGNVCGLRGIVMDITSLKEREASLRIAAETDPLTSLRNRRWLRIEGARAVAQCSRHMEPFSLAFLDVDNMKRVNDGPGGHEAGDRLLTELARRLEDQVRLGDILVRMGGDEFVAFLPKTTPKEAETVAYRLASAVAHTPFAVGEITVSVGVSTWEPGEDFEDTLRRADTAMYRAKGARSNSVE